MNDLMETEFFVLMSNDSQAITNEQMQSAYRTFIARISALCQVGNDLTSIIRELNITRTELVFLASQFRYAQKKNLLKLCRIDKALAHIDSELSLIYLWLEHPGQFRPTVSNTFQSELHIIPKSQGLGIIGLAEVVIALFLTKGYCKKTDSPPV